MDSGISSNQRMVPIMPRLWDWSLSRTFTSELEKPSGSSPTQGVLWLWRSFEEFFNNCFFMDLFWCVQKDDSDTLHPKWGEDFFTKLRFYYRPYLKTNKNWLTVRGIVHYKALINMKWSGTSYWNCLGWNEKQIYPSKRCHSGHLCVII